MSKNLKRRLRSEQLDWSGEMAGSYNHLINDGGWSLIENMGDAYECVEELWWIIERAIGEEEAKRLIQDEFYPMQRGEIEKDAALLRVQAGMEE